MLVDNTAWARLGARVGLATKCTALPTERASVAVVRNWCTFLEMWRVSSASHADHPDFVRACLHPLTLRITLVGVMATRDILLFPVGNRRLCYANCN